MIRHRLHFIVVFSVIAFVLSACGALNLAGEPDIVSTLPPQPTQAPPPNDLGYPAAHPDVTNGAMIFAENCTRCHGENGAGDGELVASGQIPYPGNMADWAAASVDVPTDWFETITIGNLENLMPPWGGALTEQQRWDVAMYAYTIGYTPEQIELGEMVYAENCVGCHGENGAGDGPRAAELGIEPGDLSSPVTMVTLADDAIYTVIAEGIGDEMPAFGDELSAADIQAAVAYARSLSVNGLTNREAIPAPAATEELAADEGTPAPAGTTVAAAPAVIEGGVISGTIVNETEGGGIPDDGLIELHIFDENFVETEMLEAPLVDGSFTFSDATINPQYVYVALVNYNDRQFISEPTLGTAVLENRLDLPIVIYESTDDASVITINSMAVQVSLQEDTLQVLQVIIFNNTSDRLFTIPNSDNPDEPPFRSVQITLPPGAVIAGMGANPERYIVDQETFTVTDTQAVLPGTDHTIQLAYFIPFERDAIIEHPLDYDMNGIFRLLMQPTTLTVTSEQIQGFGDVNIRNTVYGEYGAELTLNAGDAIRYELARGREAILPGGGIGTLPLVLFILSGVSAVLAVGLFVYGRMGENKPEQKLNKQVDDLVSQIAKLDREHEAGSINHDVYQRQRADLKAQLRDLMEQQDNG